MPIAPGRYDMPHRHFAVLDQVGNHRLGAIHAQLLVHGGGARGVSKTLHVDDVASRTNGIFRQLLREQLCRPPRLRISRLRS